MKFKLHIQKPKQNYIGGFSLLKGVGIFFDDDEKVVAQLNEPKITVVGADVMILIGYEPIGYERSGKPKFRLQEWFLRSYTKSK